VTIPGSGERGKETSGGKIRREQFRVHGHELLANVEEIVYQGNIRRPILKDDNGRTIVSIPAIMGVVGALVAP
jgi:hypothetical protein